MPAWDTWVPYILYVTQIGEETTKKVIENRLVEHFSIPEDLINQYYDSDPNGLSEPILFNRIGFSLSLLYQSGALERPKSAVYQITDSGKKLLEEHGESLNENILKNQEA